MSVPCPPSEGPQRPLTSPPGSLNPVLPEKQPGAWQYGYSPDMKTAKPQLPRSFPRGALVPCPKLRAGEGRRFRARQFSWWPRPEVKVNHVERDLRPRRTLSCHHHFKFTCLRVPGGDPNYSFLTSLSHIPLAFSLRSRHPWPPHSPRVQNAVRTFPGSRFYQSSLLHFPEAPASTFSWTQALPDARGFSPDRHPCGRRVQCVQGPGSATPISSCPVLNSRASP